MRTATRITLLLFSALALLAASCRGDLSEKPPIHPVLDMDFQPKVKAQSAIEFAPWQAEDGKPGRGMRLPPAGTVSKGSLTDADLDVWKRDDEYLANPVPVSMELLQRGQQRFNIYCAACHDKAGSGHGLVLQRANRGAFNAQVPHLGTEQRLRDAGDGYIYEVIRNGYGTMPAYGHQLPIRDRWAIVHYLRALQLHFNPE